MCTRAKRKTRRDLIPLTALSSRRNIVWQKRNQNHIFNMQTHSQVQRSVHTVSRLSKYSLFIFQCAMHTNYVFVIISFVFFIVPFLPWCFQLHQPKSIYSHNYSIVSLSIQCVCLNCANLHKIFSYLSLVCFHSVEFNS